MAKGDIDRLVRIGHNQVGVAIAIEIGARHFVRASADGKSIRRRESPVSIVQKNADVIVVEVRGYDVRKAIVIKILHCRGYRKVPTRVGFRRAKKAGCAGRRTSGSQDKTCQ